MGKGYAPFSHPHFDLITQKPVLYEHLRDQSIFISANAYSQRSFSTPTRTDNLGARSFGRDGANGLGAYVGGADLSLRPQRYGPCLAYGGRAWSLVDTRIGRKCWPSLERQTASKR